MTASEIRRNARENLTGKWGKVALIVLCYFAIEFLLGLFVGIFLIVPVFGFLLSIAYTIFTIPMSYGLLISFLKLKRGEDVGYTDFIATAFSSFTKVWSVIGYSILKLLPYFICLLIGFILIGMSSGFALTSYLFMGKANVYASILHILSILLILGSYIALIPKGFSLALIFPILYDHPQMKGKEIVEESFRLMDGHRWDLFYLYLTFIGWGILAIFTFYIGYLFLVPYMFISFLCFYEFLCNKTKEVEKDSTNVAPSKEITTIVNEEKEEIIIVPKEEEEDKKE